MRAREKGERESLRKSLRDTHERTKKAMGGSLDGTYVWDHW